MDGRQCLNRFQLDNDLALYDYICAKTNLKLDTIVNERYRLLELNLEATFPQIVGKPRFICRFEQARAKPGMNLVGGINNLLRDLIFGHR